MRVLILLTSFALTAAAAPQEPITPHAAEDPITVRVLPTRGGPQIHVNGKPIAPRFFWGSMNGGSLRLGEEWAEQGFEFSPGIDVHEQGTLHFRFGQLAGKIDLADLRIRDAQTGEDILPLDSFAQRTVFTATWHTWPPPSANTVGKSEVSEGALHITLVDPPDGHWPDFHFHSTQVLSFRADRTYRCTFGAKASPARAIQTALYQVANGSWNNIGGPPGPFLSQVVLARDAGVNLVSFTAPECWSPPEKPVDWSPLDTLCRRIIAVNSNVLLVPRVGADAPGWWLERHPQSRMVYDLDKVRADHASVSDRAYRADAAAHLEKLCRHLSETFPRHFAGIHPCGQNTGEWFYQDSWERPLSGYDAATVAAFRAWLKSRGYRDSKTASVPNDTERRRHPCGYLRDPARERRLIDFARFQQMEMADHVAALAAACRRGTAGKKLVIFFYGYLFEFGALQNGAPTSGHYALNRLLGGKDIDILCSPISYTDREWLGTKASPGIDTGWDVFVGTPRLTPELLRVVARLAGVHVFTEANVPVWAAEGYVAIQAHVSGPVTVDIGQALPVVDALDNQPLGHGPHVSVPFKQGETRVLRY